MKKHRWLLAGVVAGISALAVSSCAYDPYYSGGSYSPGGYGYGDGYGYGGSGFSTSLFISTGNSRWGYDPYAGAYYDYTRRCYYDPYLSGYYPLGYRPRYVHGSPHPHGWRSGRSYIAPPTRIRSYNLTNYRNRTERYRGLGRDWSRNVSTAPASRNQSQTYGRSQDGSGFGGNRGRDGSVFGSGREDGRSRGSSNDRGGFSRGNGENGSENRRGGSSYSRGNISPQPPVNTGGGSFGGGTFENSGGVTRGEAPRDFSSPRRMPEPQAAPRVQERVRPQMEERVRPQPQERQRPSRDDGGRRSRGDDGDERGGRGGGPIGLGEG